METGVMATMHAFFRQHQIDMDPAETVIYGPSTANQVSRNFVLGNSKLVHIINIPGKLKGIWLFQILHVPCCWGQGRGERLHLDFTDTSQFTTVS